MAPDSVYNKAFADYAVSFIEALSHTKGTWAGKPFELIDWQEQIIRDVFGTLKPNGYRQFNTAYVEIPKKMGKSELAAAVALLLTCGDTAIDEQMKSMQQELMATVNSKNTGDELGLEIRRLRDEKQALQNEQASRQDLKKRIDELMRFLNDLPCELIDYEEDYVRTLLEKITVYDDHIIVEFKSGIEIQIDKEI